MYKSIRSYTMLHGVLYGVIRKTIHVNVCKVKSKNYDSHQVKNLTNFKDEQLYLTTQFGIIFCSAASCGYLWPLYVCKDIYDIEKYLRGDAKYYVDNVIELLLQ